MWVNIRFVVELFRQNCIHAAFDWTSQLFLVTNHYPTLNISFDYYPPQNSRFHSLSRLTYYCLLLLKSEAKCFSRVRLRHEKHFLFLTNYTHTHISNFDTSMRLFDTTKYQLTTYNATMPSKEHIILICSLL